MNGDSLIKINREILAKLDYTKGLVYKLKNALLLRLELYPSLLCGGFLKLVKTSYRLTKGYYNAIMNGTIYPLRLRVDGETDLYMFISRLCASITVIVFNSAVIMLRSKLVQKLFILFSVAVAIYLFFGRMGYLEMVKESKIYIYIVNEINVDIESYYLLLPISLMLTIYIYLGYEMSRHYKGLRVYYNSFLMRLLKIEKKNTSMGLDYVSSPPQSRDDGGDGDG